jgi:hypothetical protein
MNYSIEQQKKIIQAGRYSLVDFSIITNRNYKPSYLHEEVARGLEMVESGQIKRLIIQMPPRHGKSQLASINFPAWFLGRNPDKEIITASYASDLAIDFGTKTRDLISGEVYKEMFDVSLKEDEKSKGKWKTNQGGSYTSVGVGGAITGRGADILIIDDPFKNREEADSQVIREKVWNWYTSTAYTRLEKDGKIVIIATRWHLDDLIGRLFEAEKQGGEQWYLISFPAIATEKEEFRNIGDPLWPQKYDLPALEVIKKTIGPYDWQSLYQQNPVLSENQEFRKEWIKERSKAELDRLDTRKFLTIDTAMSKREGACYTGFCDNSVDRENFWNIMSWRKRMDAKELCDELFRLYNLRNYEKIGIEKTTYTEGIKPFLDEEMRKRKTFLPIIELPHKGINKEIRIRGLIPRYASGSVFHITGYCDDLEEEQFTFPKGLTDDVLDAEAYQLQLAEQPYPQEAMPQGEKLSDDDPYLR